MGLADLPAQSGCVEQLIATVTDDVQVEDASVTQATMEEIALLEHVRTAMVTTVIASMELALAKRDGLEMIATLLSATMTALDTESAMRELASVTQAGPDLIVPLLSVLDNQVKIRAVETECAIRLVSDASAMKDSLKQIALKSCVLKTAVVMVFVIMANVPARVAGQETTVPQAHVSTDAVITVCVSLAIVFALPHTQATTALSPNAPMTALDLVNALMVSVTAFQPSQEWIAPFNVARTTAMDMESARI
jgi:hypothetical protein